MRLEREWLWVVVFAGGRVRQTAIYPAGTDLDIGSDPSCDLVLTELPFEKKRLVSGGATPREARAR